MNLLGASCQQIGGRDRSNGAVQPQRVVVSDIVRDDSSCVVEIGGRLGPDRFFLECSMPAFEFPIGLGVVRGLSDMRHSGDPDELLEVASDELRPVVGDDSRCRPGEPARGPFGG